jgi:predicted MFS family arabinose efflux permease
MRNQSKAMACLLFAFFAEACAAQVIFIYVPLSMLSGPGDEVISALLRATVYLGPVACGYLAGKLVDGVCPRDLGFLVALALCCDVALYGIRQGEWSLLETFVLLSVISIGIYILSNLRACVMPRIVHKDLLPRMNAGLLVVEHCALILSPVAVSSILMLQNSAVVFYGASICFLLSSLLYRYSSLKLPPRIAPVIPASFMLSLRVLVQNKPLVHVVYIVVGNNAFTAIYLFFVLLSAADSGVFNLSETPFLLVSYALGSIFSGLVTPRMMSAVNPRIAVCTCSAGMAASGVTPLGLGTVESYYVSAFFVGFFGAYVIITAWTLRQALVPADLLGKVTGITSALFKVSMLLSVPLAGLISGYLGSAVAIIAGIVPVGLGLAPMAVASLKVKMSSPHTDGPDFS